MSMQSTGIHPLAQGVVQHHRKRLNSYLTGGFKAETLDLVSQIFNRAINYLQFKQTNPSLPLTAKVWVSYEPEVTDEEILEQIDAEKMMRDCPISTITVMPTRPADQIKMTKNAILELVTPLLHEKPLPVRFLVEFKADELSYGTYYAGAWGTFG